jgi:hypothetical protein
LVVQRAENATTNPIETHQQGLNMVQATMSNPIWLTGSCKLKGMTADAMMKVGCQYAFATKRWVVTLVRLHPCEKDPSPD